MKACVVYEDVVSGDENVRIAELAYVGYKGK